MSEITFCISMLILLTSRVVKGIFNKITSNIHILTCTLFFRSLLNNKKDLIVNWFNETFYFFFLINFDPNKVFSFQKMALLSHN